MLTAPQWQAPLCEVTGRAALDILLSVSVHPPNAKPPYQSVYPAIAVRIGVEP